MHLLTSFSLDPLAKQFLLASLDVEYGEFATTATVPKCKCSPSYVRPSLCSQCNKQFKNTKGLRQHIGKMHVKNRLQSRK